MGYYFDNTQERWIVRSYKRGSYAYVGGYLTEAEAKEAERKWREEYQKGQTDEIVHTQEWFIETSKRQIIELTKKYGGKPRVRS